MNIAILPDWFETLGTLPCLARLSGQSVAIFNVHLQDIEPLAAPS